MTSGDDEAKGAGEDGAARSARAGEPAEGTGAAGGRPDRAALRQRRERRAERRARAFNRMPDATTHPKLNAFRQLAEQPETLDRLIRLSVEKLSFFTLHGPRCWEYPAIYERVARTNGAVADLGAGLSPLPLALAEDGREVITVDNAKRVRDVADKSSWSEWGFLDYAQIDPAIRSVNADFGKAGFAAGALGCIYSVSVIEHVPAEIRRQIWREVAEALAPGGKLVMTIDLQSGTRLLHNKSTGIVVDAENHGSLDDVLAELDAAGLTADECIVRDDLPHARIGIALVVATRR